MTRRALALTAVFLASWTILLGATRPGPVPRREPLLGLPYTLDEWHGQSAPPLDSRVLAVLGADDHITRVYRDPNRDTVGLFIGYHASQRQGASIHSPMNCLPGAGWIPTSVGRLEIASPGGSAIVNRVVVQKDEQRQLVLYWYQSQGRIVASEYASKVYLFLDALRKRRTDAALVRVIAPVTPSPGESRAEAAAVRFAAVLLPHLSRYIPD